jgi:hypothetical protein
MKWFAFILSLYALLLTVVPCNDAHALSQDKSAYELVDGSDHMNENHIDTCSPFCACTCCQLMVEVNFTTIDLSTQVTISEQYNFQKEFLENYHPDCFRPPIV